MDPAGKTLGADPAFFDTCAFVYFFTDLRRLFIAEDFIFLAFGFFLLFFDSANSYAVTFRTKLAGGILSGLRLSNAI